MWETFDWRRESRGAEAGGKRQKGAPCHQSLFVCPEERAFQPGEGSGGLHAGPGANSHSRADPREGKHIPKLYSTLAKERQSHIGPGDLPISVFSSSHSPPSFSQDTP